MVPLVPTKIVEKEKMETSEDIKETSKGNVNQIEMYLNIIILMIKDQECSSCCSIVRARKCK